MRTSPTRTRNKDKLNPNRSIRKALPRLRVQPNLLTCPPRLILTAFGKISFSSLENCVSRLLGSREVVMRILGSLSPALAYSSSMCVLGTAVLSSSSSFSCLSPASSFRSSFGMGFPSAGRDLGQCLWHESKWSDAKEGNSLLEQLREQYSKLLLVHIGARR